MNNRFNFFKMSKEKSIIGFFLFCFLSILFFNFLHIIRLTQILIAGLFKDYEFILYSKFEEFLYNFSLAFVAVHFSFSIVYNYFLDKPKNFLSRYNYKRKTVLNNQRVFNWFFIYWFVKMAFLISLFLDFIEIDYLGKFKYLPILFAIVLIGQIWISLRPFLKIKTFKSFLITVFAILSSSLIFSQISFVNFEKIQKVNKSKNIIYKNDVHIVTSEVGSKFKNRHLDCNIIVSKNKIIFNKKETTIDEISYELLNFRERFFNLEIPYINHILIVDRNVEMKFVNELKRKMNEIGIEKISYSLRRTNRKVPFYFKSDYALRFYLPNNFIEEDIILDKEVNLKIVDDSTFLYKDISLSKKILSRTIKDDFNKNGVKSIRIYYHKENSFAEYFNALEATRKAINNLRDDYSKNVFGTEYSLLDKSQKGLVIEKYYWHIIDDMY